MIRPTTARHNQSMDNGQMGPFQAARNIQHRGPQQQWHNMPQSAPMSVGNIPSGPIGGQMGSAPVAPTAAYPQQGYGYNRAPAQQSNASAVPTAPAFSALTSDPMAAFAVNTGKQIVQSSVARYLPGVLDFWHTLRFYFHVDNNYVKTKLLRVVFPFRHRDWMRERRAEDGPFPYAPPVQDSNCPDLYIPLMAAVTYVLAMGLLKGIGMKFHPEILSQVMSAVLVTVVLETLVMKAAFSVAGISDATWKDIVAWSGYKYVGLVINLLAGIFLGQGAYYLALLYTGASMVYFMINTLTPISRKAEHESRQHVAQKNYTIIAIGGFQFLLMWWLGSATA